MTENWHQNLKNKNREELIAAAKELFMKQSFLKVNIKDVCHVASVSRVTFYKHFQSMNEIVFEVQMEILESMTEFVRRAPTAEMNGKQMLTSMLDAWIDYAGRHPEYIKFILLFDLHYEGYDSNEELKERYKHFVNQGKERHFLIDALEAGIQDGSLKSDAEPLQTAHFVFTSMMGLLQKMSLTSNDESNNKIQDINIANRFVGMLVQYLSSESDESSI
ncbi:TetR/AcrR family transcriptional regulator [Paenibacillus polymyxa]|uniref:TetR/AcrR family transcriptional regulator n=1 Tax=Paenibacillus polymyxa TaxID=1406 RepID=UPI0002F51A2B|nr:TetR/AcrR family transcriptional regulator [Paenibacillus polymyxa]AHM64704.1 TetR family transcriptional regulator [Paenibacillus polymyxa SQR-21]AIY10327.1 TetR family transcriptional regulator [Paenibacillus polymyxa]MDN4076527.1 TetR/AcrR family transcriptional regulator [Paenibacillus polymyxa]MDN4101953.1 TetR/AcrR family transcriptional regulator [Paenibacillus polymyxa]MDN4112170.1 TetR/AcrR family transcriptional regulator [Paenibacillus polymyxa]